MANVRSFDASDPVTIALVNSYNLLRKEVITAKALSATQIHFDLNNTMASASPVTDCTFTAGITGGVLNVSAVGAGVLQVGSVITITAGGYTTGVLVASLGTGTGTTGTYNLTSPQGQPPNVAAGTAFTAPGLLSVAYCVQEMTADYIAHMSDTNAHLAADGAFLSQLTGWITLTVYAAGAVVKSGSNIYVCITGGTSGATTPSSLTPALGVLPVDGTVYWFGLAGTSYATALASPLVSGSWLSATLAQLYVPLNLIKVYLVLHGALTTCHVTADTIVPIVAANATSLATALTLAIELRTKFNTHTAKAANSQSIILGGM